MADQLRVSVNKGSRRRMVNDLALRDDLLSRYPQEFLTKIISYTNWKSPYLVFTNLFGAGVDLTAKDKGFTVETSTIGSEFIRIREETETRQLSYVVDNSQVPDVLVAGIPFDVSLDFGVLDEDEQVKLWDDRTILRVVSRRNTNQGYVDVTFVLVGQVGETASGSLLQIGKPVNWGFGNTKGEGSQTSNSLALNPMKRNEFVNPTMITRYGYPETGSAMSDEVFTFGVDRAMDGSTSTSFRTSLPVNFFRQALASVEGQIMDSRSNFDPLTLEVNGYKGLTARPDRPSYAGIRQQLDQARIQYRHPVRGTYRSNLGRIDSIMQQIRQIFPGADILAVGEDGGMQWLRDTIREGAAAKYPVTLFRDVPASGKVDIGFGINKYTTDHGDLFMYDMTGAYQSTGEYKTFNYNGIKGKDRSREIFFIPVRRGDDGSRLKSFTYYTKSGNGIDRGFVYGKTTGITGQFNGATGTQLMNMQDTALQQMMNNQDTYNIGSTVDGIEHHLLFEGVPYIDIMGIIKLTLQD